MKQRTGRVFVVFAAALLIAARALPGEGVTPEQVNRAIKRGVEAATRNLEVYRRTGTPGYSIVCIMSLLNAGVSRDDPAVAAAIKNVLGGIDRPLQQYEGTYQAGLVNMLLGMLKDPSHKRLAERMASQLIAFQSTDGGWGDYSRTQFALLGLKAASDLGVKIPPEVFKKARRYIESGQNKSDGGWGYTPNSGSSYGSMTAAAITGLFIANEQAYRESAVCGAIVTDETLDAALRWLGNRFTVLNNPNHGGYHYYYLYALERIGVLTGQKYIGGRDWYREGAEYLVKNQGRDGNWQVGGLLATEFALLFLGKGGEPVVMQKLSYGRDWNTDPYDAKDLVEQASRDLKMPMCMQVVETGSNAATLARAPILYMQGRRAFKFSPQLREAVKTFVDQGGFLFASACCGSAEFDKSFREEMSTIFPDSSFDKLPPNHDIFVNHHKILAPTAFMIEGLNTGCRTSVLYAPHDICCAWSGCRGCRDRFALAGMESKNLGVNMITYALNFKKVKSKLDDEFIIARAGQSTAQRNALVIGQIHHNGDWNPDPGSIPNLTQTLKSEFDIKGEVACRQVTLGVDDPGDYPLLYITGHRGFQLAPTQVDALRTYLDRGGFLLADPCCGKLEFDTALRKLCEQLYADRPLAPLPAVHPVLKQPYSIEKVAYKPAVKNLFPAIGETPQLEGISNPDGRLMVLYSRFNLGCELQGHGCANCLGLSPRDAFQISVNAVNYALSH